MSEETPKPPNHRRRFVKDDSINESEPPQDASSQHPQPEANDDVNPINLFSSVFVTGLNNYRTKMNIKKGRLSESVEDTSSVRENASISDANAPSASHSSGTAKEEETEEAKGPAFNVDDHIPVDREKLRDTKLYKSTYKILQWQRDNYLVGSEYANWIQQHRDSSNRLNQRTDMRLPYDKDAMGHQQVAKLGAWFIPSDTVRNALLPIVVDLPGTVLYDVMLSSTVSLIQAQQANLDAIVKNTLLSLTQSEQNRVAIKNSTQGYIATTYRDDEEDDNAENGI